MYKYIAKCFSFNINWILKEIKPEGDLIPSSSGHRSWSCNPPWKWGDHLDIARVSKVWEWIFRCLQGQNFNKMYIRCKLYYSHENLLSGINRDGCKVSAKQGCIIFSPINVLPCFPERKIDKVRSHPSSLVTLKMLIQYNDVGGACAVRSSLQHRAEGCEHSYSLSVTKSPILICLLFLLMPRPG